MDKVQKFYLSSVILCLCGKTYHSHEEAKRIAKNLSEKNNVEITISQHLEIVKPENKLKGE